MGYQTEFSGVINVDPPLSAEEIDYLNKFATTRRMDRANGPYFVGGSGFCGQGIDSDVISHNNPCSGQPGLWCQWVPTEDGKGIEWDGNEKFYDSVEWMQYIIDHFIGEAPLAKSELPFLKSHTLKGEISAQGEDNEDTWFLIVKDNKVTRGCNPITPSDKEEKPEVEEDAGITVNTKLKENGGIELFPKTGNRFNL